MIEPPVAGLILAGGKSSRMGFDKGMIPAIPSNGLPQVRYLYRLLSRWLDPVFVSVGPGHEDAPAYGQITILRDRVEAGGPLAGIVRGHEQAPESALFIIAVDMFGIDDAFLGYLLEMRRRAVRCYAGSGDAGGRSSDGRAGGSPAPRTPLMTALEGGGCDGARHNDGMSPPHTPLLTALEGAGGTAAEGSQHDGYARRPCVNLLEGAGDNSGETALPEFLCAVWEPALLDIASAAFSSGERRPRSIVQYADICLLPRRRFRIFNVNTPGDLRSYSSSLTKEESL